MRNFNLSVTQSTAEPYSTSHWLGLPLYENTWSIGLIKNIEFDLGLLQSLTWTSVWHLLVGRLGWQWPVLFSPPSDHSFNPKIPILIWDWHEPQSDTFLSADSFPTSHHLCLDPRTSSCENIGLTSPIFTCPVSSHPLTEPPHSLITGHPLTRCRCCCCLLVPGPVTRTHCCPSTLPRATSLTYCCCYCSYLLLLLCFDSYCISTPAQLLVNHKLCSLQSEPLWMHLYAMVLAYVMSCHLCITWPECPKGAKDEVKRPEGPSTPRLLVCWYLFLHSPLLLYLFPSDSASVHYKLNTSDSTAAPLQTLAQTLPPSPDEYVCPEKNIKNPYVQERNFQAILLT